MVDVLGSAYYPYKMRQTSSLWQLDENSEAELESFCSSLSAMHVQRFVELGFRCGETVKCVQRTPLGAPRIFEVSSAVFSVSKEDASRIFLKSTPANETHDQA